jgi:hypothetical protein
MRSLRQDVVRCELDHGPFGTDSQGLKIGIQTYGSIKEIKYRNASIDGLHADFEVQETTKVSENAIRCLSITLLRFW